MQNSASNTITEIFPKLLSNAIKSMIFCQRFLSMHSLHTYYEFMLGSGLHVRALDHLDPMVLDSRSFPARKGVGDDRALRHCCENK